jgi:AbiTii
MDPKVRVDDFLRKAIVVATTLGIDDFRVWAAKELQGYAGDTTIPAYRQVTGVLRAYHPSRGWIPVILPDKDLQKSLESRAAGEPIGELDDLYHDPHKGDVLQVASGPDDENLTLEDLMELMPYDWVLRIFGDARIPTRHNSDAHGQQNSYQGNLGRRAERSTPMESRSGKSRHS